MFWKHVLTTSYRRFEDVVEDKNIAMLKTCSRRFQGVLENKKYLIERSFRFSADFRGYGSWKFD